MGTNYAAIKKVDTPHPLFQNKNFKILHLATRCVCNDCSYMKLNTLEKLFLCTEYEEPKIIMDNELAKKQIERMLGISKKYGL